MTKQQKLHQKALTHLEALEQIIDALKEAGPCPLDRSNAALNIRDRLASLAQR